VKYECDCGARYSNLDALLACQNANHGVRAMSRDGWLPPGVTDADIDRAAGADDDEPRDNGLHPAVDAEIAATVARLSAEIAELALPGEDADFREWSSERLRQRISHAAETLLSRLLNGGPDD
jgi:hypothetical protein